MYTCLFEVCFHNVVGVFGMFHDFAVRRMHNIMNYTFGEFYSKLLQSLVPTAKLCRRPDHPYYDTTQFSTPTYKIGDVLNIRCQSPAQLKGSSVVKCEGDDVWFPPLPVCSPVLPTSTQPTSTPPSVSSGPQVGPLSGAGDGGAIEGEELYRDYGWLYNETCHTSHLEGKLICGLYG